MQLDDFYGRDSSWLRRWYLDGRGQAVCPFPAVEVAAISRDDRETILARNAEVREAIEAVEAYEELQRVASAPKPDRYETYEDEEGERRERETAAYLAWKEAAEAVAGANPVLVALAELRASGGVTIDDETGEEVQPAPVEDDMTFEPHLGPVPNIISDRQFAEILAIDGLITEDEALAWAGPGVVPAQLLDAVEQIPDDAVRFSAKMHLVGATQFMRDNVFVHMLGMILDRDAAQLDGIWTRAAAL